MVQMFVLKALTYSMGDTRKFVDTWGVLNGQQLCKLVIKWDIYWYQIQMPKVELCYCIFSQYWFDLIWDIPTPIHTQQCALPQFCSNNFWDVTYFFCESLYLLFLVLLLSPLFKSQSVWVYVLPISSPLCFLLCLHADAVLYRLRRCWGYFCQPLFIYWWQHWWELAMPTCMLVQRESEVASVLLSHLFQSKYLSSTIRMTVQGQPQEVSALWPLSSQMGTGCSWVLVWLQRLVSLKWKFKSSLKRHRCLWRHAQAAWQPK